MRRVRGRRRATTGGTTSVGTGRIASATGAGTAGNSRPRWGVSVPTVSGCTTCTGTCGSGWRTVRTAAMRVHLRMEARGSREIATGGFCAAAPGSTFRGTSAPPSAAGSTPETAAASAASVFPGRSRGSARLSRESLPPHLRGPGAKPLSIPGSSMNMNGRRRADARPGGVAGRAGTLYNGAPSLTGENPWRASAPFPSSSPTPPGVT